MTIAVPSYIEQKVLIIFKEVKSIRETTKICKLSRNTVRKILRKKGVSGKLKHALKSKYEQDKVFSELPKINEASEWNPMPQSFYNKLSKIPEHGPLNGFLIEQIRNNALLCQEIGNELNLGKSTIGTFKLSVFNSCYTDYLNCMHKASATITENSLDLDKRLKQSVDFRKIGYQALDRAMAILDDLQGKTAIGKMHLEQNNFTFLKEDKMKDFIKREVDSKIA
jgi:hypothetical protein